MWLADWLAVPGGGGDVSGGRSVLEALDLSAGLLWGMLTCPRDAVLRSTLLQLPMAAAVRIPYPTFFFILLRTVTCIVLYLSLSRKRAHV